MKISIILVIFILISCEKKDGCKIKYNKKDTLELPNIKDTVKYNKGVKYYSGYYKKYGLTISNFYSLSDYKVFDYDFDKDLDTLVLLKPFYSKNIDLTDEYYLSDKNGNPLINDKVFLICEVNNGKIISTHIFKNLLNNMNWHVSSVSINTHKNCFSIDEDIGANNKFYSYIYISNKNSIFNVDSVKVEGEGNHQYNKKYLINKDLRLFTTKIVDSLRNINEN